MNDRERQTARRGLMIYFAVLVVGSSFLEWKILQTGESIDKVPLLIVALMYTPAAASVAARLSLHEGIMDISFRLGGRVGKWAVGLAWVYPIVVGLLAYGIAWATGLAGFRQPLTVVLANSDLIDKLRFPSKHLLSALLAAFFASFRSRAALQLEILALRHQLGVLL